MMRAMAWRPFLTCIVLACFIGGGPAALALAGERDEPHSGLTVRNGWYVHDGKVVWGLAQHNGWWRVGQRPNITRNAPGAVGPNRTEDLDRLTDAMLRFGYPGFEHNFGLWYDRRRDAHDRVRRTDGRAVPPFLEQPWQRSGTGRAWDGLSKYDLTKYNTWYFARLKRFAEFHFTAPDHRDWALWLVRSGKETKTTEPVRHGETMPRGGALAGQRPRVIISTDIGGSDPDDFQSMVHLLLYADVLDIEGLISSPPQQGRLRHILEVIDAYEKDLPQLRRHADRFPDAVALRRVARQGAVAPAPARGWSQPTDGSRWIIERARHGDPRPLWVLVWGSITDVAQAVHDAPSIKRKLRVYSIGSWNTTMDRAARRYLYQHHPDLWWIECDSTFRGMYMGGRQEGARSNLDFVRRHVRGHGALGDLFYRKKRDIKMGDTPSLLYLLRGDPDDPTTPHWGGAFVATGHGRHYWTDHPEPALSEHGRRGAQTVNRWRTNYLTDWKRRMDWTLPR